MVLSVKRVLASHREGFLLLAATHIWKSQKIEICFNVSYDKFDSTGVNGCSLTVYKSQTCLTNHMLPNTSFDFIKSLAGRNLPQTERKPPRFRENACNPSHWGIAWIINWLSPGRRIPSSLTMMLKRNSIQTSWNDPSLFGRNAHSASNHKWLCLFNSAVCNPWQKWLFGLQLLG